MADGDYSSSRGTLGASAGHHLPKLHAGQKNIARVRQVLAAHGDLLLSALLR
jgi:hypothetical protein